MNVAYTDEERTALLAAKARRTSTDGDTRIDDAEADEIRAALAMNTHPDGNSITTTLTVTPDTGDAPLAVVADVTFDPQPIIAWQFRPGDNSPARTDPPPWNHTYERAQQYLATVTLIGELGHQGADEVVVTVTVAP